MNGRPRTRRGAYAREQSLVSRSRTESAREREVFRHLHPWTSTFKPVSLERPAFPHDTASPPPKPVGCPDIALAAFAQLGALRLNAHRCIISLLSSSVEYVLAEATRTISLQYDTTGTASDELWLGTSSFLRDEGLHALALDDWHKAREFRDTPDIHNYYYTEGQSPHWLLISDVRTRPELQERQYIKSGQSVRFFCSVPIRSQHGSAIGSYTIIDDKPRYGISTDEMNFLEDMADTVTSHLEATKTRAQRQRSERLIKGLGLFNTGRDSLKHWWLDSDNRQKRRGGRHLEAGADIENDNNRQERLDEEFGVEENTEDSVHFSRAKDKLGPSEMDTDKSTTASVVTRSNSAAAGDRRSMNVASQDFGPSTDVQPSSDTLPAHALVDRKLPRRTKTNTSKQFDLSYEVDGVFARASNLMREAIGAEGVMFLDANMADIERHRGRYRTDFHDSGTAETSGSDSTHTGSASDSQVHESDSDASQTNQFGGQPCDLLGFSTRMRSSLGGSMPSKKQMGLSRDFIERLTLHYPRGKVFNYAEGGSMYSSSGGEGYSTSGSNSVDGATGRRTSKRKMSKIAQEAAILSKVLSGVRTIAFLPLWDSNRERWRAGALVWSNAPLRYFDTEEDLTYIATFGNSVVAELARLDAVAADTAKTTFISSVSHELRSPLHGVLAGVEFLQESELTPFQEEMTTTISMAGHTLLNTINHILDYSKINNFTRAQKQERAIRDASRHKSATKGNENEIGVTSDVDFARLTEDVVETVVAANRFQRIANAGQADHSSHSRLQTDSPRHRGNPVSVVVDIPCRRHWRISMQPGSWTRIVTNLLGNSLKYTKQGVISVKLDAGNAIGYTEDHEQIPLTLTIQDTGIGISKQYMENNLYTPFVQEDSHSSGTGLGLSIVKQIVHEIGGKIVVKSCPSWGTKVVINFVGKFLSGLDAPDCSYLDPSFLTSLQAIKGKRVHMITPNEQSGKAVTAEVARLRSSLTYIFINWLDVELSSGSSMDSQVAVDAYVIAERDIPSNTAGGRDLLVSFYPPVKDGYRPPLIVLGSSVQSNPNTVPIRDATLNVLFVSQPIGPRKLARVLMTSTADATAKHSSQTKSTNDSQRIRQSPKAGYATQPYEGEPPVSEEEGSLSARGPTSGGLQKARPLFARRHTEAQKIVPAPVSPSRVLSASCSDPGTQSPSRDGKRSPFGPKSVLLVEDNEINMKLLIALMRRLKVPYDTAENGLVAVEKYSKNPGSFFLILTDISMPIMDGFTATEKIRDLEKREHLERCSIVAITGVSSPHAKEKAWASGVDKFMTKPISMNSIKALVQEVEHGIVSVGHELAASPTT